MKLTDFHAVICKFFIHKNFGIHLLYEGHYVKKIKVKVKQSCNRPVAQRVPGGLGSQISMRFST
jgi:hypothetical protein